MTRKPTWLLTRRSSTQSRSCHRRHTACARAEKNGRLRLRRQSVLKRHTRYCAHAVLCACGIMRMRATTHHDSGKLICSQLKHQPPSEVTPEAYQSPSRPPPPPPLRPPPSPPYPPPPPLRVMTNANINSGYNSWNTTIHKFECYRHLINSIYKINMDRRQRLNLNYFGDN